MESIGYHLEDLHEHEFLYGRYKIAFSFIEDLREYAKIFEEDIKTIIDKEVKYKVLGLDQYLRVYERSIKDNYRKEKNNNKDIEKIRIIKAEITKKRQLTNASTYNAFCHGLCRTTMHKPRNPSLRSGTGIKG